MKRTLLLGLLSLMCASVNAQNSNLIVFSEEGFPFRVMLNGVFQNRTPETNVKIEKLNATPYKLKIFFQDTANGTLIDEVYLNANMEHVYVLKKKKVSETEKSWKKMGKELKGYVDGGSSDQIANEQAEIDKKNERFVLRKQSEAPIAAPVNSASQPAPATGSSQSSTTVQSGTSTTATQGSTSGVNMNVSISTNATGYSQTTSSTTTTTSSSAAAQPVYVHPGYSGPTGCPMPMNDADFAGVKSSISSKSFEDSKLTVAKQVIQANCLLSGQVREIMMLFSFENNKLDLAKYAYGFTFDLGNYFKVNDAFQFESSIDELNQYINTRK